MQTSYRGDRNNMRKQIELKEWDISFLISGDILTNILNYAGDLDQDIPVFFYEDRISIKVLDPTKSSYAVVEISKDSVMEYLIKKPRAVVLNSHITGEVASFVSKDSYVEVKLDTMIMKKIQFKLGAVTILSKLLAPTEIHYGYDKLESKMKVWMDKNVNLTQNFVINTEVLSKICTLGARGKSGSEIVSVITHEDGTLTIVSEDGQSERIMRIDPKFLENVGTGIKREEFEGGEESDVDELGVPEDNTEKTGFEEIEIMLERAYLEPLMKLKGLGNISISILPGGLPLVVNYIPYNDIKVLQTIALRIEADD